MTTTPPPPSLSALLSALYASSAALVTSPPTTPFDTIVSATLQHMDRVFTTWESAHNLTLISTLVHEQRLTGDEFSDSDAGQPDYQCPPSPTGSAATDADAGTELCTLCMRRRQSVRFHACTHGACTDCAKGLWRARVQRDGHFPGEWCCPMCRRVVRGVRGVGDGGVLAEREVAVEEWILGVSVLARGMAGGGEVMDG